jgi:hypothetical protein
MPVMVASYPTAVASFSTKFDFTDVVFAAHINALQLEVVAIQSVLGLNPQGVSPTMRGRLESIEASLTTVLGYFDGSGHIPESSVTNLVADLANLTAQITAVNTALGLRLLASNNLSDLPNAGTARTNLGAAATVHSHTGYVDLTTTQSVGGVKTFTDGIEVSGGNGLATYSADFGGDGGSRANSTAYSKTLVGSASVIDTTFTAPPSGRILQILFARMSSGGTANGYFSTRTRVNPAGTIKADYDDNTAVFQSSNVAGQTSLAGYRTISGLIPGTVYRVEGAFKSVGGTTVFDSFGVAIFPSLAP